jgi:DNA recombination protein RmuC
MSSTWALLLGLVLGIAVLGSYAGFARSRARLEQQALEARLAAQFQQLAGEALRGNSEHFMQLARESLAREQAVASGSLRERETAIGSLVTPIKEALARSELQIQSLERERRDAFTTLRAQIEQLALSQGALQRETRNLVGALRRPEVRGRWGELTLRRVAELSGLSEHCDFIEQAAVAGGVQRPDMVVRMSDQRELVVDAKTPLDAYLDATEAQTDEARAAALVRHGSQVEARIRELGSKAYWNQFAKSPDFVVLFLPGDQFLSAALAERPDLIENGMRQNVVIATPSTLIALLKAVAYGWRQAGVAEHAALIQKLGQELHKRLAIFASHLDKTGERLAGAVDAHNKAVGSLERQVLPQARRFTELSGSGEPLPTPEPVAGLVRQSALHPDDQPPAEVPAGQLPPTTESQS